MHITWLKSNIASRVCRLFVGSLVIELSFKKGVTRVIELFPYCQWKETERVMRTRRIISLMRRIHLRPSARSTVWDRMIHALLFWIDTLQTFVMKASSFRHVVETRNAKWAQGAVNHWGLYRASKCSSVLSQQWNGSLYTQFNDLLLLPTLPFYSLILVHTLNLPVMLSLTS